MNRTKKTAVIASVLLGMLMWTATSVMAAPPPPPHKPHWSKIVGGILGGLAGHPHRRPPRHPHWRHHRRPLRRHYVPGHYVTEFRQVMVAPGHYETRTQQLLVEPGHFETKVVPAVTKTVTKPDGSTEVVVVQPEQTTKVWVPDRYETRTTKVWIPAQYETRAFRRYVPGHWVY